MVKSSLVINQLISLFSIKATQLASKVDTIIIMSGDSDYVELVRHLKADGVRVEIAAVEATTAEVLVDESNYFHALREDDFFTYQQKLRKKRLKEDRAKKSELIRLKESYEKSEGN